MLGKNCHKTAQEKITVYKKQAALKKLSEKNTVYKKNV